MDRIECPVCLTSYTFSQAGIHPPNSSDTLSMYTTVCSACHTLFESAVGWHSTKTKHLEPNWFMRRVFKREPSTAYQFEIRAVSRKRR